LNPTVFFQTISFRQFFAFIQNAFDHVRLDDDGNSTVSNAQQQQQMMDMDMDMEEMVGF
jgi:hypothetical protein